MENTYIYQLSDDTNHDSVTTFSIIKDIIRCHPEVIRDKVLILRSDHCQEQNKCKYTFFQMKKLAIDLKIKFVWFYGEPGHGRGLVDAMSSFGCKLQLKNEIVTFDSWFESAEKMVSFLKEYFVNDDSKEHYLINDAETAQVRKQKREEFKLEPCRKYHVIAFDSDDTFSKSLFFRDVRIESLFHSGDVDEERVDGFDVDDGYDCEEAFALNHDMVFELVKPGTYVGMRSPTNAMEGLFIAEVQNKGIAKENLTDENGHHILSGGQYLEIVYLQKKNKKR